MRKIIARNWILRYRGEYHGACKKRIYCDYAAATPIDSRVSRAMRKAERIYANPSSLHGDGTLARRRIDAARETVARFLHALPDEIIFTSGGTEGNAIAIFGTCAALPKNLSHYHAVTTAIEHPSVLEAFRALEEKGLSVTYVGVDESGHVSEKDIKSAIRGNTMLVSVMHANNEIGTIQPIADIGRLILKIRKTRGGVYPLFHVDACQSAALVPVTAHTFHADLISLSFGKLYGPKGAGALYARRGAPRSSSFCRRLARARTPARGRKISPRLSAQKRRFVSPRECAKKNINDFLIFVRYFLASLAHVLSKNSYQVNGGGEVVPHIANVSFVGCDAGRNAFSS